VRLVTEEGKSVDEVATHLGIARNFYSRSSKCIAAGANQEAIPLPTARWNRSPAAAVVAAQKVPLTVA
jgi:hypothetical protein